MTEHFVPTSIARRMMARMQATHDRRRISVFSGPPGIGKTTAIDAFRARQPDSVVIAKVSRRHAREVLALQHVLETVRALSGPGSDILSNSVWKLRQDLFQALCQWAGADPIRARSGTEPSADELPRLTIVFDEAQNLSRQAIDALRYWNDTDRCYSPFPLGLIFVGNSEFSLEVDNLGQSVISAAVADRALYAQAFDYDELSDDDLRLFLRAKGLVDPGAVSNILRHFRAPRAVRSLRRVMDLVEDLPDAVFLGS